MKSNSERAVLEKKWDAMGETMSDNLILVLMVLREQYGFGEKRLTRFLFDVQEKAAEVNEMYDDGVFDYKTAEYQAKYSAAVHDIIMERARSFPPVIYDVFYGREADMGTNAEAVRKTKAHIKARSAVSMREAAELQQTMQSFRAYGQNLMNGGENHGQI